MSPDATVVDQPAAGSEPAESTPAQSQAPQPQKIADAFADFDKVFGGGSSENGSSETAKAVQNGAPSTEATAEKGATPDDDEDEEVTEATTATAEGQPEKKPSRTAKLHEEYQGQIANLKTEHETTVSQLRQQTEAMQRQLDEATGKVSEAEQRTRADQAAFVSAFGDDAEYERRTRIANRMFDPNYTGPTLTNDEATELARWTTARDHTEPLRQAYLGEARQQIERANGEAQAEYKKLRDGLTNYVITQTNLVAQMHGLDPKVVGTAEYGEIINHAVAVTTKRLTETHAAELQAERDKNSQLEADLRAAETAGLADRTELLPGGNSADVRATPRRVFNPKAPLDQQWDAAFGQVPQSVR